MYKANSLASVCNDQLRPLKQLVTTSHSVAEKPSLTAIDNMTLTISIINTTRLGPVPMALLVASQYVLPGYGDQRVWVRGPRWSDHCVKL